MSELPADRGGHTFDILANISDGVVAFDNEWQLVFANAAAERIFGREASPFLGKNILGELQVAADNPFRVAYVASKKSGKPTSFSGYSEIFQRWLDVRGYPHPAGYTIIFRDSSQDHDPPVPVEAARERDANRSINQRIFETSLDLILVVDHWGSIVRVSPSSLAILGYRPDEMVGRSGADFIHAEDLDSTRNEMRLARLGRRTRTFECRYIHKDGHVVPLAWTGVHSPPDKQHFFIGRDMTESVRIEGQLRQIQKMEAIGQLSGGVAHDFNNLLTVIIVMSELLGKELKDNPKLAPIVKSIDEAAARGAQLTQRMLAFARKQPLQARSIDLNELVSHLSNVLQRTLGEDISVKTALATDLWPTLADPSQLEDAILNLALNARDAMPAGGRLIIETANTELGEEYATQNIGVQTGDYVVVIVTDNGTGMSSDIIERAFEPFFTTKEVGQGSGLGLSMVYGFIKQSGGHVKIYSEIGHGTSIKLFLPRSISAPEAAIDHHDDAAIPVGQELILVVEDDPSVRIVTVSILENLGYRVLQAEDGQTALDILKAAKDVDLLFTDLIMPNGMSGQDLLRRAREQRPDLRALFTSGYSEQFITARGDTQGVPLLSKPYRKSKLAAAVREVLDAPAPARS